MLVPKCSIIFVFDVFAEREVCPIYLPKTNFSHIKNRVLNRRTTKNLRISCEKVWQTEKNGGGGLPKSSLIIYQLLAFASTLFFLAKCMLRCLFVSSKTSLRESSTLCFHSLIAKTKIKRKIYHLVSFES